MSIVARGSATCRPQRHSASHASANNGSSHQEKTTAESTTAASTFSVASDASHASAAASSGVLEPGSATTGGASGVRSSTCSVARSASERSSAIRPSARSIPLRVWVEAVLNLEHLADRVCSPEQLQVPRLDGAKVAEIGLEVRHLAADVLRAGGGRGHLDGQRAQVVEHLLEALGGHAQREPREARRLVVAATHERGVRDEATVAGGDSAHRVERLRHGLDLERERGVADDRAPQEIEAGAAVGRGGRRRAPRSRRRRGPPRRRARPHRPRR